MDLSICFVLWFVVFVVDGTNWLHSDSIWCKYKFVLESASWEDAYQACRQMNKTLANVDNLVEHSNLEYYMLPSISSMISRHPNFNYYPEFWINLHDVSGHKFWGDCSSYVPSYGYSPVAYGESGCFIYRPRDRWWFRGRPCSYKRMFICEAEELDTNTCYDTTLVNMATYDINQWHNADMASCLQLCSGNCFGFRPFMGCDMFNYDYRGAFRPINATCVVKELVETSMEVTMAPSIDQQPLCSVLPPTNNNPATNSTSGDGSSTQGNSTHPKAIDPSLELASSMPPELNVPLQEFTSGITISATTSIKDTDATPTIDPPKLMTSSAVPSADIQTVPAASSTPETSGSAEQYLNYSTSHTKIPLRSSFQITTTCKGCTDPTYSWTIYKLNPITNTYSLVSLSTSILTTGLELNAGQVEPGGKYKFKVNAAMNRDIVLSREIFMTGNSPPQNGTCDIIPRQGEIPKQLFILVCTNWTDDGFDHTQNKTLDAGLSYRVFENVNDEITVDGGTLPLFFKLNKTQNDIRAITIRIVDDIGDYVSVSISIQVTEDSKTVTFDPNPDNCEEANDQALSEPNNKDILPEWREIIEQFLERTITTLRTPGTSSLSALTDALCSLAEVVSTQTMEVKEITELVTECFRLLSESFIRVANQLNNTGNTPVCDVTCLGSELAITPNEDCVDVTFKALLYVSDTILDAVVPQNMSQQYEMLNYVTTKVVRKYFEYVSTVKQEETANNITDCTPMSTAEQTDQVRQQGKILRVEYKLRQIMVDKVIKKISSSVARMEFYMLKRLCKGCSFGFTSLHEKSLLLRNKSSSINKKSYKIGKVNLSAKIPDRNNEEIFLKLKGSAKNHHVTGQISAASLLTSSVASVYAMDTSGGDINVESVKIRYPTNDTTFHVIKPVFIPDDASKCHYQTLWYRSTNDKICLHLQLLQTADIQSYEIYMRQKQFPTHFRFDHLTEISRSNNWTSCTKTDFAIGPVYLCFRPIVLHSTRRKRDASDIGHNTTDAASTPFKLAVATVNCLTQTSEDQWKPNEHCSIEWFPYINEVECTCKNVAGEIVIGNSFYVPVNTVSFSTVFLKFSPHDQAAILGVLAAIICIYFMMCVWARYQDKKDVIKWGITPLADNSPEDSYYYLLTIQTGMRIDAGSRSNIEFVLVGSEDETGVRRLYDGVRKAFQTGSVVHFLVATKGSLGNLDYIQFWIVHEDGQSVEPWYLHRVDVEDLQTQQRFVILCNKWISNDDMPDCFDAVFPVSSREDVFSFKHVLYSNIIEHLSDNHMVTSILWRPTGSNFTRVQRVTCLFVFAVMAMISNAIYFRPEDVYEDPEQFRLGPMILTSQTVYISVVSSFVSAGTVFLVVFLFRESKVRYGNTSKLTDRSCVDKCFSKRKANARILQERKEMESAIIWNDTVESQREILPFFCRYIAWFLSISGAAVGIFFLLLFSMEWQKQKTELWLSQFFMSFSLNAIILDQIKMLTMAFIFSIVFVPKTLFRPKSSQKFRNFLKTYKQKYSEFSENLRRKAVCTNDMKSRKAAFDRHKRRQELITSLKESFLTCVFIWIVANITYGYRDKNSYLVYEHLSKTLVHPQQDSLHFDKITSTEGFNLWLQNIALPMLFPELSVEGIKLHWRWQQYTSDVVNFRVGPPRLRQLRVRKSSKDYPLMGNSIVYPSYDASNEDTSEYCLGWGAGPCDLLKEAYSYTGNAWKFTSALEIWGLHIPGVFTTYGGGGYIAEFDVNRNRSIQIIKELTSLRWIDRHTRAIFLEFTLYSTDTNMFTYAIFLAEFPETGGVLTTYNLYPLNIYQYHNAQGTQLLLYEIVFLMFVLIYSVNVGIDIHAKGKQYFFCVRHNVNFIMLIVSALSIVVYFTRLFISDKTMEFFNTEPKEFLNFYHLVVIDYVFVVVLSVLLFLVTLKLLHILEFNKNIEHMLHVWKSCILVLSTFSLVFLHVLLGYAGLGFLLFGSRFGPFKDVFSTFTTLLSYIIGTLKSKGLNDTFPFLANIYFFAYALVQSYFLLTILLSILCDSIKTAGQTVTKSKAEDLFQLFCEMLGKQPFLQKRSKTVKAQSTKRKSSLDIMREMVMDINKVNNKIQEPKILTNERKKKELERVNITFRRMEPTHLSDIFVQA